MSGSIAAFASHHTAKRPAGPRLTARLRALAAHLAEEWRVRRAMSELQSLDARGLHDIGLTPGSIEGAIRHGLRGCGAADAGPDMIRQTPEWPDMPSSWTEWR